MWSAIGAIRRGGTLVKQRPKMLAHKSSPPLFCSKIEQFWMQGAWRRHTGHRDASCLLSAPGSATACNSSILCQQLMGTVFQMALPLLLRSPPPNLLSNQLTVVDVIWWGGVGWEELPQGSATLFPGFSPFHNPWVFHSQCSMV